MSELEKLRAELKQLNSEYAKIKTLPPEERGEFGRTMNQKKQTLLAKLLKLNPKQKDADVESLDISAPAAPNQPIPVVKRGD